MKVFMSCVQDSLKMWFNIFVAMGKSLVAAAWMYGPVVLTELFSQLIVWPKKKKKANLMSISKSVWDGCP